MRKCMELIKFPIGIRMKDWLRTFAEILVKNVIQFGVILLIQMWNGNRVNQLALMKFALVKNVLAIKDSRPEPDLVRLVSTGRKAV